MKSNKLREYLLSKPGAKEDTPFGPQTLVYKVGGKLFALCGTSKGLDGNMTAGINLKVVPEFGEILRADYESIVPGYHMNKRHWITVYFTEDCDVPDEILESLIDGSYDLIVKSLTKKARDDLNLS